MSIHLRGADVGSAAAASAVVSAYTELHRFARVFATDRPESDLVRLRSGRVAVESCNPLVLDALRLGEEAAALTGGAFTTLVPAAGGDLAFDPTGLVTGWAVEQAASWLAELPGTSYCINAGGDLRIGAHAALPLRGPDAIGWRVGVEDPHDRSTMAGTVTMTHGAVATCGAAARGPREGPGSVTVIGPSLLWAHVWAAALFVGGERAREAFALRAPDYLSTAL